MFGDIYAAISIYDFRINNHPTLPFLSVNTDVKVNMEVKRIRTVMYYSEVTSKLKEHDKYLLKAFPLQAWTGP